MTDILFCYDYSDDLPSQTLSRTYSPGRCVVSSDYNPFAGDQQRLKFGGAHPHVIESWQNLKGLYKAWSKPEKVEEWRAKLPKIEAVEE